MKKTYIYPHCRIISLDSEEIIASSTLSSGNSNTVAPEEGSYEGIFQGAEKDWESSDIWN